MASIRWYRVPVYENEREAVAYFYETDTGLFDLQYGWGKYTTHLHDTLEDAVSEFKRGLHAKHEGSEDAIRVDVGEAVEVQWDEVKQNSPANSGLA